MTPGGNKTIVALSMSISMAHVVRPLEVAKLLREKGYRIVFAGDGKAIQIAKQAGFELRYLPDWDLGIVIAKLQAGEKNLHPIEQVDDWVRKELELYEEEGPVLVLDDARLTSGISSNIAGLPRISLQNAYQNPYAIKGSMGFEYKGPRGLLEPGDEVPYLKVWEKYGLPLGDPFSMFEPNLTLLCDIPEYAPMHEIPSHYKYIGPVIWGRDLEDPPWLDELDPEKPKIYFTMGSTGPKEAFQAVIQILGGTKYQVMMTLGSMVSQQGLDPLPPGFFSANFASGDILASRADVMVCHGGNGTAYQALQAGIPIISLPTIKDQHWNAQRLSELGVGITISTLADLLDAVMVILENPTYREASGRFRQIIKGYDGPKTAANLIHKFLKENG